MVVFTAGFFFPWSEMAVTDGVDLFGIVGFGGGMGGGRRRGCCVGRWIRPK